MSEPKEPPKKKHTLRNVLLSVIVIFALITACMRASQQDNQKYLGHGFEYMHGYSSTDFTGYHVYDSEKLYQLDRTASLRIEDAKDFPVLDGAEACYPVYSALALAAYRDIDAIELDYKTKAEKKFESRDFNDDDYELMDVYYVNGKYVTFTNSSRAYYRLCDGLVDLLIGAAPSDSQKGYASVVNEQIVTTPIGKEAFVFFTQTDNPVDNLTSDEIRAIYHGDITNWKELGGKNQKIVAFQRPEESGSQVAMRWFMGDVPMADPKTVDIVNIGPMGGVVSEVAQYNDEAGALGYTFRYFLTGLNQEENVKILSVDGIYPDTESIANGRYPAVVNLVCASLLSNEKPYVKAMLDFMLSDDGQEIIEKTGYAPLPDRNVKPTVQNELIFEPVVYSDEAGEPFFTALINPESGECESSEIYIGSEKYKGLVNPVFDEDNEEVENTYRIFNKESLFEFVIVFDHEAGTLTFVRTEYNNQNLALPPAGKVFYSNGNV